MQAGRKEVKKEGLVKKTAGIEEEGNGGEDKAGTLQGK